jgi:hypothetical protein
MKIAFSSMCKRVTLPSVNESTLQVNKSTLKSRWQYISLSFPFLVKSLKRKGSNGNLRRTNLVSNILSDLLQRTAPIRPLATRNQKLRRTDPSLVKSDGRIVHQQLCGSWLEGNFSAIPQQSEHHARINSKHLN